MHHNIVYCLLDVKLKKYWLNPWRLNIQQTADRTQVCNDVCMHFSSIFHPLSQIGAETPNHWGGSVPETRTRLSVWSVFKNATSIARKTFSFPKFVNDMTYVFSWYVNDVSYSRNFILVFKSPNTISRIFAIFFGVSASSGPTWCITSQILEAQYINGNLMETMFYYNNKFTFSNVKKF